MAANLSQMQRRVLPLTLIVVVMLIALRWYGPSATQAPEKVARQQLGPYLPETELLQAAPLKSIVAVYQRGDSAQATELIIDALEKDTTLSPSARAELTLALANFNLRQGHPDLARTRLLGYDQFPRPRQRAEANWWLAISYLTEGNVPAARRHLQQIASDDTEHRDQDAQGLGERLPAGTNP